MKQFFLLTVLLTFLATVSAQAQCCPYSKTAASESSLSPAALQVAASDASIEKRLDEATGQATFVRKRVCPTSGKVSYTSVEYCSKSGKFVNVSPREKQCIKSKANCKAKDPRATKVSAEEKAHCTAAQRAACAKSKASSNTSAAKVKLVKQ